MPSIILEKNIKITSSEMYSWVDSMNADCNKLLFVCFELNFIRLSTPGKECQHNEFNLTFSMKVRHLMKLLQISKFQCSIVCLKLPGQGKHYQKSRSEKGQSFERTQYNQEERLATFAAMQIPDLHLDSERYTKSIKENRKIPVYISKTVLPPSIAALHTDLRFLQNTPILELILLLPDHKEPEQHHKEPEVEAGPTWEYCNYDC